MSVRPPAVAGTFYPATSDRLRAEIDRLFEAAAPTETVRSSAAGVRGLIVPHAGYQYSGATAACGYRQIAAASDDYQRVVLIGPAHRVAFDGIASLSADAMETPLGRVSVDRAAIERLARLGLIHIHDEAHRQEHSLEVHLPLLQTVAPDASVVPLVIGRCPPEALDAVLGQFAKDDKTLFIISTDLSHFRDYDSADRFDAETAEIIERFAAEELSGERACGHLGVGGLLRLGKRQGWDIERLARCNSGDSAGSKDRVVGYGAWVLRDMRQTHQANLAEESHAAGVADDAVQQTEAHLDEGMQRQCLLVAAYTILARLRQKECHITVPSFPPPLQLKRAVFVTLRIGDTLRGCVGSLEAIRPLIDDVAHSARSAAFADPRFPPLRPDEFRQLSLSISVLSQPEPLRFADEMDLLRQLRPGTDGLILASGGRRGTLLPAVWNSIPHPERFLQTLKQKTNLDANAWPDDIRCWRYTSSSFSSHVQELPGVLEQNVEA